MKSTAFIIVWGNSNRMKKAENLTVFFKSMTQSGVTGPPRKELMVL